MSSSLLNVAVAPAKAIELGRAIDCWRRTRGLTQAQLLRTAKVSQGQLSRILSGRFSRTSAAVLRLCQAANVDLAMHLAQSSPGVEWRAELERALSRTWDGTPNHARELIKLLRVAQALRMS